jgi:hypothetical protein
LIHLDAVGVEEDVESLQYRALSDIVLSDDGGKIIKGDADFLPVRAEVFDRQGF